MILNVGLRHDDYDTFGGTTNPRLALIYRPLEPTTIKFLYGRAFRAPSPYELYYNDGNVTSKANPDLEPETIETYELVLEQFLGIGFRLTASLFFNKSMTSSHWKQTPPMVLTFTNVNKVETKEPNWNWKKNGTTG